MNRDGGTSLHLLGRWGLAAVALGLAVVSLTLHRDHRSTETRLLALLERPETSWLASEVARRLPRELDGERAKLLLARALVAAEFDPELRELAGSGDPAADREAALARLALARELTAEAWVERPAAWQAPMLLGAATYLDWSQSRDDRLFTAWETWDRPLMLARELAPGKAEPGRFLVAAYLELWPALAEDKRRLVRLLLRRAFEDPVTFQRLIGPWVEVAETREELFAALPSRPRAWELLLADLAQRGDWGAYREARERWQVALGRWLTDDLDEAERRRVGGDLRAARALSLAALAQAPPGERYRAIAGRALTQAPPGASYPGATAPFTGWLDWALDRCLIDDCPLPPKLLDRLAGLVGDLPPARAALVELLGTRRADAELLERRSNRLWHEDWAPYHLAKARRLAAAGDGRSAAAALGRVHRSWHRRPLYAAAALEVARSTGDAAVAQAETLLAELTRDTWDAYEWKSSSRARLEMLTGEAAAGLAIALDRVPPDGAVIEVGLDGSQIALAEVAPGDLLEIEHPIPAGLHLLELSTLAGGAVLPGRVALTPAER